MTPSRRDSRQRRIKSYRDLKKDAGFPHGNGNHRLPSRWHDDSVLQE